jgi:hypothetical protein
MSDPEATFYDVGYSIAEVEVSQMFGKKCINAGKGGKPFCAIFFRTVWSSS